MKILFVGATGTMGQYLTNVFEREHQIIRASRSEGDIKVDITSSASITSMYENVGAIDAVVSTAGPSFVGPWAKLTETEFRQGLEGKFLGQINLVLIGQHYLNPNGSFTLITGALSHDPQKNFANASAANGGVNSFVQAAAIELPKGIRINAVSPTVIEHSPHYQPYFPGDIPVTMHQLEFGFRKSLFGSNTGKIITP